MTLKKGDFVLMLRSAHTLRKGEKVQVERVLRDGTVVLQRGVYLYGPGAVNNLREGVTWTIAPNLRP